MKKSFIIRRSIAFLIDFNLTIIIGGFCFFIGPRFNAEYLLYPSIKMFSCYGVILSVLWFLLFPLFKDCIFKNASLGKKILGIQIVNIGDKTQPLTIQLIKRNIMFYFIFIEIIVFFLNSGRTVGDVISNTAVVYNKDFSN